ncbi:MAG: GNAT family N-acetyltransferase [Blastocatellia bacterium]
MTIANQTPDYTIRQCRTLPEFSACLEMQKEVWQFSDLDVTPLRSFVITLHSGGFTLGAFDGVDKLLGFAHALAAFDQRRRPYFYSHMLAVTLPLQNAGIGAKLKLAQRDYAIAHGLPLMTWTFDPLQSRNAYLNIVKLGGVVRQYKANYYGNESSSTLHAGLDTDRLMVEWWTGSEHVARALDGLSRTDEPVAAVEVPFDIQQIKDREMKEAQRWQLEVRTAFQHHLAAGLYCAGFERGRDGANSRYLFFRDDRQEVAPGY